ncbi:hypothetical protein LZ906_017210 (plasmid) [Paraclostridium ghonii]|uniref:hypothetical protein n=1 Tax=Paraclostridium ghonii TaxID=29358 RepID=UPI00202D00B6|nr:hypothetical protein [Paeniclostridium ghonii]MCM0165422.1 hypothetical protein [Paeniclostridium ghonii]
MEYRYKFTLNEYSRALTLLAENNPEKVFLQKLVKKIVVGACALLGIIYFLAYGFKAFLVFSIGCSIMLFMAFCYTRPENIYKRTLKAVSKQVDKDPEILNWKSILFEEDSIIFNYNKKTLKTKLIHIGRIIEKNDIILILDCNNDLCGIIPCSYFHDISSKIEFLNKVKNEI